jgi:hypothetical protein
MSLKTRISQLEARAPTETEGVIETHVGQYRANWRRVIACIQEGRAPDVPIEGLAKHHPIPPPPGRAFSARVRRRR